MGHLAKVVTAFQGPMLKYAEGLLKDISDAQFARLPQGPNGPIQTNHPAFVYGHLSVYPNMLMNMLGIEGVVGVDNPDGFEELFLHGNECRDDPDNTIYPSKEAITSQYFKAYKAAYAAIAEQSDDFLAEPLNLPDNEFANSFASKGALAAFMLGAHPFLHIGQLSAWRRCMGLGPIF